LTIDADFLQLSTIIEATFGRSLLGLVFLALVAISVTVAVAVSVAIAIAVAIASRSTRVAIVILAGAGECLFSCNFTTGGRERRRDEKGGAKNASNLAQWLVRNFWSVHDESFRTEERSVA
jgi:hypothetical protein